MDDEQEKKSQINNNVKNSLKLKLRIKLKDKELDARSNSNIIKRKKSPFVKRDTKNFSSKNSSNEFETKTNLNKVKSIDSEKKKNKRYDSGKKGKRSKSKKDIKKANSIYDIKEELKDILVNKNHNNANTSNQNLKSINNNEKKESSSSNSLVQVIKETPEEINERLDKLINKLLLAKEYKPNTEIDLLEEEIKWVIIKSYEIIKNQPVFIELNSPINICGDVHGQFYDLLRLFNYGGEPPKANYLFLGDYVDRGKNSLETIVLLLCYKIKYPENFFMLRGNHESDNINKTYGFYDECKRRVNIKLWKKFNDLFNIFPITAIIKDKILCMHGG